MNVAQERPRSWTPHIILFSIILHVVMIYYIAVAFQIVPPPVPTFDPPTIQTVRINPVPPTVDPDPIKLKPPITQRIPKPSPVPPTVEPSPITPTASGPAQGPIALDVRGEVGEQPVAQSLPAYPRSAQERGVEGRVVMSITIMPDGTVRDVQVVEARPRGYFEAAAVRAVQTWRYRPSNMVRRNVIVHMDFELKDA
ncbi:MAG: TonB family protein [Alphaproteobacteria bacterium]|jgi:TonB family protein|nr:TonB family protein [Alphaproteobacteria bacterium]